MKTFEQVVDKCLKPAKVYLDYMDQCQKILAIQNNTKGVVNLVASKYIEKKYIYSKNLMSGDFYGKDINEPVVKICKRILNNLNRFQLDVYKEGISKDCNNGVWVGRPYVSKFVVVDRDTNQKFVVENNILKIPTCLTDDENRILVAVLKEWYTNRQTIEKDKKVKREQKRKDKFRQELTDLYKDL